MITPITPTTTTDTFQADQTIRFANTMKQSESIILELVNAKYPYVLYPHRSNTFTSILLFRNLIENVQKELLANVQQVYVTQKSIAIYVKGMRKMGKAQESLTAEIANAISCMEFTQLQNCKIKLQLQIQMFFFPFETWLSNVTMNKERGFVVNTHTHTLFTEQIAHNLIYLRKALIKHNATNKKLFYFKFAKTKTIRNETTRKENENELVRIKENTEYVNSLIQRTNIQINKFADMAQSKLTNHTYKKLKQIAERKI